MIVYVVTCRGKRGTGWGGYPGVRQYIQGELVLSGPKFRSNVLSDLRKAGDTPRLVGLVHGYNVTHPQSLAKLELARTGVAAVPGAVLVGFSWPSQGLTTHYLDDRGEARYAGEQLAALIVDVRRMLERERCEAQLSLIVHSMGAYVLARAARYAAEAMGYPASYPIFQEVVMFAPDVDAQALESDGEAHEVPVFARRLTVYWSKHDGALLASSAKRAGITGARLGRTGPASPERTPDHVVSVDCSAVVRGHSAYFEEQAVIEDVQSVLSGVDRSVIKGRQPSTTRVREWSLVRPQATVPGPMMVTVQGSDEAAA